MKHAILSKDVLLLDVVKKEILKGEDELSKWIGEFDNFTTFYNICA